MSDPMGFDEATSRRLEAAYLSQELVAQRRATLEMLRLQRGEHVIDVGSGPGFLAAQMAAEVGVDGLVVAVDPSVAMRALAAARELPRDAARLEHHAGDATALPVEDRTMEVLTSTQVYEYVADLPAALAEARRVLKSGGRIFVLDTDWDSLVWHSSDPARMKRVLTEWDAHLVDPCLPRRLPRLLREAGFAAPEVRALPLLTVGWEERSFAAGLIGMVEAFVAGRQGIDEAEAREWATDLRSLGADSFFSLNRYLFLAHVR